MFRVMRYFDIYNTGNPKEDIEGLFVGEAKKHSIMVIKRHCQYIKDYGNFENYEKNFELFDEDFINVLSKIFPNEKNNAKFKNIKVSISLMDAVKIESNDQLKTDEKMTFRKWCENRSKENKLKNNNL